MKVKNLLITGMPGAGKTTLLIRLAEALEKYPRAGFVTKEIREEGARRGFELVSISGKKRVLSHVNRKGPYRVGKYGVDLEGFDAFLGELSFFQPVTQIILIDEIGKMECLSPKFRDLVIRLLDSDNPVIATIARTGPAFIERIRARPDVMLVEITPGNRASVTGDLIVAVNEMIKDD
ncbi:MAG TPA: nucleoside-triphosphatase [Methanoregulaceae archaeon]|nr:nucleoside-triphosphatase [Methanoregulaceae archaeon]